MPDILARTETISLTVTVLTYLGQDGSSIFSGQGNDGNKIRVVASNKALPRTPAIGEVWEITGEYREHSQYGRQLHAKRGCYSVPRGRLIVDYLANHPDFVGIGDAKAKALYEAFGDELVGVLDSGDVEALWSVLTGSMAERLVAAWAEKRAEGAVVSFLDKYGFDIRLANKLQRVWGTQALLFPRGLMLNQP